MPAFIANAFPEIDVDVVEIDDVVVDAAERALGLPGIRTGAPERSAPLADRLGARGDALSRESERRLANLRVVVEDASAFMARAAGATRRGDAPPARAIFLDAFDGAGETPRHLTEPAFLRDCAARVRIGGVVVANCFNGARGSKARRGAESFPSSAELRGAPRPHGRLREYLLRCRRELRGARAANLGAGEVSILEVARGV